MLGVSGISSKQLHKLTKEADLYGDMILLEDVSDEHISLTNRTLKSFQYILENNMNFQYVLKCDDDSFVNLLEVSEVLMERKSNEKLFWGEFLGAGGVMEEGPYAEKQWSVCETYLPYALGGGYVLSMDLVKLVVLNGPHLRIYRNEDVSLGAWLAPYNINYVADLRFDTGAISRGCKKPFIVTHKVDIDLMHRYFRAVMKEGIICTKGNYKFNLYGYRYNWRVHPSKCCRPRKNII